MGWSKGAQVLDEVWAELAEYIPKKQQDEAAKRIVDIFLDNDADTISSESTYPLLRKVARELVGYSAEEDEDPDGEY